MDDFLVGKDCGGHFFRPLLEWEVAREGEPFWLVVLGVVWFLFGFCFGNLLGFTSCFV